MQLNSKFFKLNPASCSINGSSQSALAAEFNSSNSAILNTKMRRKAKVNTYTEPQNA